MMPIHASGNAIVRKILRDVWRERTRATLVVLAIAIGLAGFFAVLSTYAILRRELDRGYLATNPASATFVIDAVDEALIAEAIARADVADADARRVLRGEFRNARGESRGLLLFVVRDFRKLRISTIASEAGAWPPAADELLIERDAFQVARADIGETVTIALRPGHARTLRVAGRVHDPGQAQARMEHLVYAYITPDALARLGEPPTFDRLLVTAAADPVSGRVDEPRVRRVAHDVRAWLEARGHHVRRMDVPAPGEHPHAIIMGVLLLAMAAFGLVLLALSGIIVVNLLLAMMAAQRRQIGVMKAIGATRGQIAGIYLAEAAIFGAAAIIVALPAGLVGGRMLSRAFAQLLNFDLASLAIPIWVYLLVIAVGLLVPLAAAAWPVASGVAITVQAAIAGPGVGVGLDATTMGASRLDRMLTRLGGGRASWMLGIRNSVRHRARTALTLVTLAAAGASFMSALNVRVSIMATLDRLFGDGTYGAENRYAFDQHMLMIYVFLLVSAGLLAAVGSLGLVTATSLNMRDRRRELGVLRTIGATPAMVAGIVITEALFIALLAWVLAMLAAWPIGAALGRILTAAMFRKGLVISVAPAGIVGWLGISTTLAVIASVLPAMQALRHPIREAISHE